VPEHKPLRMVSSCVQRALVCWALAATLALVAACTNAASGTPALPATSTSQPRPSATAPDTARASTPTPRPLTRETALEAVVQFAVDAKIANLTVLEAFTGGFSQEILSDNVKLTQTEYDTFLAAWQGMALNQERTLAAMRMLGLSTVSADSDDKPAGAAAPSHGVVDSARGFYEWMSGAGKRSRERIGQITSNMSEDERQELFNELKATAPESTGGAADATQFYQKLQRGELDTQASRIHNDLLLTSASSTTAGRYTELAQDKGLLTKDIVVAEGRDGLEKGAKFAVDASFAALEGPYPGLSKGKEYAEKTEKFLKQMETVYEDPGKTGQVVSDVVSEKAKEQFKKLLGKGASDKAKDDVDLFGKTVGAFVADALGSGPDADTEVRAAEGIGSVLVTAKDGAVTIALREGEGDGAEMVVFAPDDQNPAMELPAGDYSVRTFDEAGKELAKSKVTSEPGWEQVADAKNGSERMADAKVRASRTPTPRPSPTQVVPFEWVLSEVVINPENRPLRADQVDEFAGTFFDHKITDGVFTTTTVGKVFGNLRWDFVFTWKFDRPPARIKPDETFTLKVTGTRTGTYYNNGFTGSLFQFSGSRRTVQVGMDQGAGASAEATGEFTTPNVRVAQWTPGAFLWNCSACNLTWVYKPQDIPVAPVAAPPLRPVDAAAKQAKECVARSQFFRTVCQTLLEQEELFEKLNIVARLPASTCASPPNDSLRQQCALQAATDSGDSARCDALEPALRLICRVDLAETKGDIDLVAPFGDEGYTLLVVATGSLEALSRIKDGATHDHAVFLGLNAYLGDILTGEADKRVAPASFCSQIRGGWADETDYPEDDEGERNQCEQLLGMARAIQLDAPDECDLMKDRFVPSPFNTEEDIAEAVSECRLALEDYNLIASR